MSSITNQGTLSFGLIKILIDGTGDVIASSWVKVPVTLPCNIGFGCELVSGGGTYTVQHRFGDSPAFNHEFVNDAAENVDGNYAFPISEFRIVATDCFVNMYALVPGVGNRVIDER